MSTVFEHERTVTAEHIDLIGHVGNLVYMSWLLDAAQAHSESVGLSFARYRELGGVFVVRRHEVDYLGAAREGDVVVVRTWITRTSRASSVRAYEVLRDTECLVRATTTWAFVSLDSGRPCRIPPAVRAAFEIDPT